eukprot:jgi/Botrbrau1/1752/Bobra.0217s0010.1
MCILGRTRIWGLVLLFVQIWSFAAASEKVLVLLEDLSIKNTHSLYFNSLTQSGFDLTFRRVDDRSLRLREWDNWVYDKLVLFAANVLEWGGAVDTEAILEFVEAGHDLIMAVDSTVTDDLRGLAADLGLDIEAHGTTVIDHVANVVGKGALDHSLVFSSNVIASKPVTGDYFKKAAEAPVVFQGIGLTIAPESQLAIKVLGGGPTTISSRGSKAGEQAPAVGAASLTLVGAVQLRNNARFLLAGSIALFSNDLWGTAFQTNAAQKFPKTGNAEFALAISRWAFQQSGKLRASSLRHAKEGEKESLPIYRIKDTLDVSLDLHTLENGVWVPYKAEDVQLEYVMLDPYVRQTLAHDNQGTYSTQIAVPDVYGVFKFVVDYKPVGYSHIHLEETAPVRPYRHTEYDRFLLPAYPYYASTFSAMAASSQLGFFFLYHSS